DWLMVLFCITSLGIFYFYRDKKFLSILTSILSINALIYYLATIKGSTFESLYEDSFCRITVILNYSCIINTNLVQWFEAVNILQVIISFMCIIIAVIFILINKS